MLVGVVDDEENSRVVVGAVVVVGAAAAAENVNVRYEERLVARGVVGFQAKAEEAVLVVPPTEKAEIANKAE